MALQNATSKNTNTQKAPLHVSLLQIGIRFHIFFAPKRVTVQSKVPGEGGLYFRLRDKAAIVNPFIHIRLTCVVASQAKLSGLEHHCKNF